MHLTVFLHNLSPTFLWSSPWTGTLHFILHSSPNHCLLLTAQAHTSTNCFAVVPRLCHLIPVSLNPLLGTLSCSFTLHIHLTIFISVREVPPHFPFLWARSHFHATYTTSHTTAKPLLLPKTVITTVLAPVYIDITADTNHSSTPTLCIAYLITSLGTLSKAFSKSTKPK